MKLVCNFNITLWEDLGFKFEVTDWFEGGQIWYSEKEFDRQIFSLRMNTHSGHVLAKIESLIREKLGNHVVFEEDALEWFSEKSEQFSEKLGKIRSNPA